MRPAPTAGLVAAVWAALASPASPASADDDLAGSVIFARGAALYRSDPTGRGEIQIAELTGAPAVRALRSDGDGSVLLVDLAGTWAWLPLDGRARQLIELPCGDGPAQLAEDGTAVLCRAPASDRAILVELSRTARGPAQPIALEIPIASARLVGYGTERALIWADAGGVWTAPPGDPKRKTRVAGEPPVRGFLASPDGARGIGVYADQIYADVRHAQPAELLMTLQLDGQGARRKAIRDGVAVEWSHDSQWVLVQDGASACIMRATGGQYKCWRGYTAASLSSDGRWALAFGNRDGSKRQTPAKPAKPKPGHPAPIKPPQPHSAGDMPWDHIDEPSDEPEAGDPGPAIDDVSVAPPSGPLALYRLRLEGAFTDRPTLVVKVVDGAAVWIPKAP